MKFVDDMRRLSFNINTSIIKEHQKVMIEPDSLLIGRLPNIRANFIGSDNPLSFEENKTLYGPSWKYFDSKFEYNYNQYGHRTDMDLHNMPNEWGLALGCSGTEGQGLPLEDMWHQKLDLPVYNAGVGGAGNDLSLHNMQRIFRIARPKYVFFQLSLAHRFFVLNETNEVKTVGMWDMKSPISKFSESVKESIETGYDYSRSRVIIDIAQNMAELIGAKIIFIDAYSEYDETYIDADNPAYTIKRTNKKFPPLSNTKILFEHMGGFDTSLEYDDLARDRFHVGSDYHIGLAKRIKSLM